eukprot:201274-Hanusia_phi.AAC.1
MALRLQVRLRRGHRSDGATVQCGRREPESEPPRGQPAALSLSATHSSSPSPVVEPDSDSSTVRVI